MLSPETQLLQLELEIPFIKQWWEMTPIKKDVDIQSDPADLSVLFGINVF